MWLFTTAGFYSVVRHRERADTFLVRGRKYGDLHNLFRFIPQRQILELEYADYRYRILVSREEWRYLIAHLAEEIDYPDFKSKIARTAGQAEKAKPYAAVWKIMADMQ